jgi:hypothetical protein
MLSGIFDPYRECPIDLFQRKARPSGYDEVTNKQQLSALMPSSKS